MQVLEWYLGQVIKCLNPRSIQLNPEVTCAFADKPLIRLSSNLVEQLPGLIKLIIRSRPNWITGPGQKSGSAGKSESCGPENGVSRWCRLNSDIYSQNYHFGLVYDPIYQFLGMEAKNYKFGNLFCKQCHPSLASGDADIWLRNAPWIHTCHLFSSWFCLYLQFGESGRQIPRPKLLRYCFQ